MRYVALLRAVNVGGTGKLPMAELREMGARLGFENVRSYIASGNLVFDWDGTEDQARAGLEGALEGYAGKPVGVVLRAASSLRAVLEANPFPNAPGNLVGVLFLDGAPNLDGLKGQTDEEITLGAREIYIHYPSGMGRSKLRLPEIGLATMRNLNTVAKLVEMAEAQDTHS